MCKSGNIARMKRVPVPVEDHRKAKAKAAEMGLTLERYVSVIINYADREPAETIMGWVLGERREDTGKGARKAS